MDLDLSTVFPGCSFGFSTVFPRLRWGGGIGKKGLDVFEGVDAVPRTLFDFIMFS